MVSGESDRVLLHDPGGVDPVAGLYDGSILHRIDLVCVPTGCEKYIYQFSVHPAIFCSDVLCRGMGIGRCAMGHKAQPGICVYLCDAPVCHIRPATGKYVPVPDRGMGGRAAGSGHIDLQKI